MLKNLKLKLVAAAALLLSSTAFAGIGNFPGDGSVGNPYELGAIGPTPTTLSALLIGTTGSAFEEYAIHNSHLPPQALLQPRSCL